MRTAAALPLLALLCLGCPGDGPEGADPVGDGPEVPATDLGTPDPAGRDLGAPGDMAPGSLRPGTSTLMIMAGGQQRSVVLHVPAGIAAGPLPLVIALHGNGDTADNFLRALRLEGLADAGPFVLAVPQGIAQTITVGNQTIRVSWDAYRGPGANIDLPLLDALRGRLLATGSIDPGRVLVFGYSQGGYMAFRYGMDAAGDLSCAAVAAAANPLPGSPLVAMARRKIPVALQIGDMDGAVAAARTTRDELQRNGHPVRYDEIAGAGHVPFPGDPRLCLDWCLMQRLP